MGVLNLWQFNQYPAQLMHLLCQLSCPCRQIVPQSRQCLCVWVVSFNVGGGDWGSGLYGIVEPLPAIVLVAGGISKAKHALFVHVYFKIVAQPIYLCGSCLFLN
eukprot:1158172-Pelagomonas_calceolata.AAC.7